MVRVMVFNATLNNISAISWLSVLLVEEIGVTGEKSLTNFIHIILYGFEIPTAYDHEYDSPTLHLYL